MPRRFHWIDGLRGLAALAVLLAHYDHFFLRDPSGHLDLPNPGDLPYASLFSLIYGYGHLAVPLFWMISGFVFTHVYLNQPISARGFAVARFARLYPMHFVTLLVVAAIQITSLRLTGHEQIYGNTDLTHFALNLLFASQWSTQSHGLSFNGPIWSVSLEIVVYGLFFVLVCLGRLRSGWAMLGLAMLAGLASLMGQENLPLIRIGVLSCACYFFTGGALYKLVNLRAAAISTAIICACLGAMRLAVLSDTGVDTICILLLATALILGFALLDVAALPAPAGLRGLGKISYSLYLVHVPVQMVWLLGADLWLDGSRSFAEHPATLPIYAAVSLTLAWLAHARIEQPANMALRQWFARGPSLRGWLTPVPERSS